MLYMYQGESLEVEVEVKNEDGTPYNLSESTTMVSFSRLNIEKTCVVEGNVVSFKFVPSDTVNLVGDLTYEIKVKDAEGNIKVVSQEVINIKKSYILSF